MEIAQLHQLFTASSGVTTDSRKIAHNTIFFALKGDNFNGNSFALDALKKGASYAVVDENVDHSNVRLIRVDDVLTTLQQLATFHRKQLNIPVLALTGSNGKTTTKELLHAVLSKKFRTGATIGNLNNHIGVPLTLLSFDQKTELGIVEMGANHQKEIEALCEIALPDFGLITNFGKAHLEGFGGVEGVIKGKSELYNHLKAHGKTIFYNCQDDVQIKKLENYDQKFGYGSCNGAGVSTELTSDGPFVSFKLDTMEIHSNLSGSYNYNNLAYAAAVGHYFKVSARDIKLALEAYTPQNNRSQLIRKENTTIILDAYNANPSSMKAALENFASQTSGEKHIAILGDMFELGSDSAAEHQAISDLCRELQLDGVLLAGSHFFKTEGPYKKFESFESLKSYLETEKITAAHILIKGSRGMALERVLEYL